MSEEIKQPNNFEVPEELLTSFQAEIAELKRQEQTGEAKTGHLLEINPDELMAEDMVFWQRIKHYPKLGTIEPDDLKSYKENVRASGNASRKNFLAFIGNKSVLIFGPNVRMMSKEGW